MMSPRVERMAVLLALLFEFLVQVHEFLLSLFYNSLELVQLVAVRHDDALVVRDHVLAALGQEEFEGLDGGLPAALVALNADLLFFGDPPSDHHAEAAVGPGQQGGLAHRPLPVHSSSPRSRLMVATRARPPMEPRSISRPCCSKRFISMRWFSAIIQRRYWATEERTVCWPGGKLRGPTWKGSPVTLRGTRTSIRGSRASRTSCTPRIKRVNSTRRFMAAVDWSGPSNWNSSVYRRSFLSSCLSERSERAGSSAGASSGAGDSGGGSSSEAFRRSFPLGGCS